MVKSHTISRIDCFKMILPGLLSIAFSLTPIPVEMIQAMAFGEPLDQISTQATKDYSSLLKFQPWRVELYEEMAFNLISQGLYQEAIAAFEKSILTSSITYNGITEYGQALLRFGDTNKALRVWQEYQSRNPQEPGLYERIFTIQLERGEIPGATNTLRNWNACDNSPELKFLLAQALSVQDPENALATLETITTPPEELEPQIQSLKDTIAANLQVDDPAYYFVQVGKNLAADGAWEFARFAFEQAVALNASYADAWALLGESRWQTGGYGLPDLQQAITIDPRSVTARALYGLYLRGNGEFDQAISHYEFLANAQPANPTWYIELGNTSLAMGEIANAVEYFRVAISLDPADPRAWKALAWVCASYGIDIRETALPAVRQAILLAPGDISSQIIFGQIFQLLGDNLSAERAYLQGLRLDGSNLQAHYYLGVLYLESGNREKAFNHLSLATQTGMNYPEKDLANRYIEVYFSN